MKYKVGDKVRYKYQNPSDNVEVGEVGIICGTSEVTGKYGVAFETKDVYKHNCAGLCRDNYGWWCEENTLELVVSTLAEIKEKKLTCCINVKNIVEAQFLDVFFECKSYLRKYCENAYKERVRLGYYRTLEDGVAFQLTDGVINDNCSANFYRSCGGRYGEVYEFSDLFPVGSTMVCDDRMYQRTESGITNYKLVPEYKEGGIVTLKPRDENVSFASAPYLDLSLILPTNSRELEEKFNEELAKHFNVSSNDGISAKNGGKNSMKFTFYVTDWVDINKTNGEKIPMKRTVAYIGSNTDVEADTSCPVTEYDERIGCLIATAKISAKRSTEAKMMYNIARNTWGTELSWAIFFELANTAFNGNFERAYKKFHNDNIRFEKKRLTCNFCGKVFETIEEKTKHENEHIQNKKNKREKYLIRKEAKRRLAEAEREGKIEQTMKELYKK